MTTAKPMWVNSPVWALLQVNCPENQEWLAEKQASEAAELVRDAKAYLGRCSGIVQACELMRCDAARVRLAKAELKHTHEVLQGYLEGALSLTGLLDQLADLDEEIVELLEGREEAWEAEEARHDLEDATAVRGEVSS